MGVHLVVNNARINPELGKLSSSIIFVAMTSLLTLDHTTLFFHTLSLSRKPNSANPIQAWRDRIDYSTSTTSGTTSARSTSTVPATVSTISTTSRQLKRQQSQSLIDLSGPTPAKRSKAAVSPKKPKALHAETTIKPEPQEPDDSLLGGASDHDELHGKELEAAKLSPVKGPGAPRPTSSVSGVRYYFSEAD